MLSLKDIKLAVNNKIKEQFPDVDIQSKDVKEGFKRPSFFVQLDNIQRDTRLYTAVRDITVRIYYFAEDRYKNDLENMDVLDGLESCFNLNFTAGGKVITINDTRGQTIDGVLEFEFDFQFYEDVQEPDDSDLMQELELKTNV